MARPILKQTGKFKSFDGTSIYYEVRGTGEPIILIYGLACLINHWHFQIAHFSKRNRVIAFDIRGHHKSQIPQARENISLEAIAHDLPRLFRELGIKKAHFVGHSLGAQALLKTYELYPEIFKSLTFINGFAKNPIKGMFGLDIIEPFFLFVKEQYEKNPAILDTLWKTAVDNPISMVGAGLLGGFNLKLTQFKDIEIYARGVSQIPLDVFIPFFEDMMKFQGEQVAATVKAPTLIISGARDNVTPFKFQKELHRLIKGSTLIRVPYGSHCTQLDFPEYINLTIDEFIESLDEPAIDTRL
ncbi:MAG: alpha/beta hydrolase [Bdellovibrio sp. CG10_big_fil_rev_8_21_14_0_10_47_8]|nr:MAG: alpha/beta hydrolase [Bdellovibrio sp. CG10_big_fil_rev_8_21_14_0_10_47_8]